MVLVVRKPRDGISAARREITEGTVVTIPDGIVNGPFTDRDPIFTQKFSGIIMISPLNNDYPVSATADLSRKNSGFLGLDLLRTSK